MRDVGLVARLDPQQVEEMTVGLRQAILVDAVETHDGLTGIFIDRL